MDNVINNCIFFNMLEEKIEIISVIYIFFKIYDKVRDISTFNC